MEVSKMVLYLSFPVGMFIMFNAPSFYEDAILTARTEIDRRTDHEGTRKLKEFLQKRKMETLDIQIQERADKKWFSSRIMRTTIKSRTLYFESAAVDLVSPSAASFLEFKTTLGLAQHSLNSVSLISPMSHVCGDDKPSLCTIALSDNQFMSIKHDPRIFTLHIFYGVSEWILQVFFFLIEFD